MIREKIENFLNNKHFENFIITLIVVNLVIFILQTDSRVVTHVGKFMSSIEFISMIIFTIEYFLRVLILNNVKEIFNKYMIIDLLAIFPYYLSFITINTVFLRVLRLFRLFRLAKLTRYAHALRNICDAFAKRKNELIITFCIFLCAVLIASTLIYFAEHNAQPKTFRSIPSCFWWSIITFTTVGYGDTYPITVMGKTIAGIVSIFGIGLHGLLIGVISTALMDVIANNKEEKEQ